jgi:iron complex transport system permease protein
VKTFEDKEASHPMSEISLRPIPALDDARIQQARLRLGARSALMLVLLLLLIIAFLMVLSLGSASIPLDEIVKVLTGGEASKAAWTNIVLKIRLPKAITATLAGASLAVSGLQMQTFFRNPLADPFVLGISSGASLGVALVILSSGAVAGTMLAGLAVAGDMTVAAAASIGAGIVMLMVLGIARRVESTMTLLILGLMIGYLTSALVSILLFFSIPEQIQAYINWTFGSFNNVTWGQINIFAPIVLIGLAISLAMAKSLNALLLGEEYARSMGLNVMAARLAIVASTAILAGTITAFVGPLAFIGIAVPHLARAIFSTSDHRVLLPGTILLGGIVALIAALIAEVPGSNVILPLNGVTSLIGAPVVIWVILRRKNMQHSFS